MTPVDFLTWVFEPCKGTSDRPVIAAALNIHRAGDMRMTYGHLKKDGKSIQVGIHSKSISGKPAYTLVSATQSGVCTGRADYASQTYVVFADDIKDPWFEDWPAEPHFILETSKGNHQVGWLIEPSDPDSASILHTKIQIADTANRGNRGVRLMRIPDSVNWKPGKHMFSTVVHQAKKSLPRYNLKDLAKAFKIDLDKTEIKTQIDDPSSMSEVVNWYLQNYQKLGLKKVSTDVKGKCPLEPCASDPDNDDRFYVVVKGSNSGMTGCRKCNNIPKQYWKAHGLTLDEDTPAGMFSVIPAGVSSKKNNEPSTCDYLPIPNNRSRTEIVPNMSHATLDGIVENMLGIQIHYDTRSRKGRAWFKHSQKWKELTDMVIAQIFSHIACCCKVSKQTGQGEVLLDFKYKGQDREDWLLSKYEQNSTDFFKSWLDGLPPWDGVRRIDNLITDFFEVSHEQAELAKWASRYLLIGSVIRTITPGAKLDELPVLIGEQGIGKSTLPALLFPGKHRLEWYGEGLALHDAPQKQVESLLGNVITEISEMPGSTRAEIERVKGFLSRCDDRIRLPFRRNPESIPRCTVFIGTSNNESVLPSDPSGNRRFVAIEVAAKDGLDNAATIRNKLKDIREQLWAEAIMRAELKEQVWLPNKLKKVQKRQNVKYKYRNEAMEDEIIKILDQQKALGNDVKRLNCVEFRRLCQAKTQLNKENYTSHKIRIALDGLGYEKRSIKIDGKVDRFYMHESLLTGAT